MKNWTDKIINWHQLPATEVRRLIATWGKSPAEIAKYDRKHGLVNTNTPHETSTKNPVDFPKATAPAKTTAAKKSVKPATKAPVRQKHTGADGEVKFVEHRNLYVGFWGGKVVVTKRTAEQCQAVLRETYKMEV